MPNDDFGRSFGSGLSGVIPGPEIERMDLDSVRHPVHNRTAMTDTLFKRILQEALAEQDARLDKKLDERFTEQDARLDERLDKRLAEQEGRLDEKLDTMSAQFDEKLEHNNAVLFGQLTVHFDQRLTAELDPILAELSALRTIMDGIAKRLETDDQERAAMIHQLDRHDGWIGQLAKHTGAKLVPER